MSRQQRLWRAITSRKGLFGTFLTGLSIAKAKPWTIIEWGGDMVFLGEIAGLFWDFMDRGIVQGFVWFAGVGLIVWAIVRTPADPVEQKPEGGSLKAERDLALVELREAREARDRFHRTLNEVLGELGNEHAKVASQRTSAGLNAIRKLGHDCRSRDESVRVDYVRTEDRKLALAISRLFNGEAEEFSPWRVQEVRQILTFPNPREDARIVLFADHQETRSVSSAINRSGLLPEPVRAESAREGQDVECLVVIFDHRRGH